MGPFHPLISFFFSHCSSIVSLQGDCFPRRRRRLTVVEWANSSVPLILEWPCNLPNILLHPLFIYLVFVSKVSSEENIIKSYGKNLIMISCRNAKWYLFITVILLKRHLFYIYRLNLLDRKMLHYFPFFQYFLCLNWWMSCWVSRGLGKAMNKRVYQQLLILETFLMPFYVIQISCSCVPFPRDQLPVTWQLDNLIN